MYNKTQTNDRFAGILHRGYEGQWSCGLLTGLYIILIVFICNWKSFFITQYANLWSRCHLDLYSVLHWPNSSGQSATLYQKWRANSRWISMRLRCSTPSQILISFIKKVVISDWYFIFTVNNFERLSYIICALYCSTGKTYIQNIWMQRKQQHSNYILASKRLGKCWWVLAGVG